MRNRLVLTILAACLLLFTSCRTKEERTLNRLEKLSEKIEKYGDKWDADDWLDALEEMEDIHYDIDECEFTKEQLETLGHVEGQLTATILNKGANALNQSISDFTDNAGIYMKGFVKGYNNNYDLSSAESLGETIHDQLIELEKEIAND